MLRKIDFEILTEIHVLGSPDTEKVVFFKTSVRPSVCPSVRLSVRPSVCEQHYRRNHTCDFFQNGYSPVDLRRLEAPGF